MPAPKEKQFIVNELGETTGERYNGVFRAKQVLTQREEFIADERRRMVLGALPETASVTVQNTAYALGQLAVRLVEAPTWWNPNEEAVGGLDLTDKNIIATIFTEAMNAEKEWRDGIAEKAKKAEKVIKKTAKKRDQNIPVDEE